MTEFVSKEPVAIIGLGCVLPDAPDVATFWDNVLAGISSIREVPHERWNPALHWSADKTLPDKTYAKIGGFVLNDAFNGLDYRMPPTTVAQIDPVQRWALAATRQALKHAGYKTGLKGDEGRDFDRSRCAIILGNAMGGELQKQTSRRVYWPEAAAAVRANPDFQSLPKAQQDAILGGAEAQFKHGLIPITEDTMPGSLSNVVAGRIANLFDLSGKNFTTDAACASSFAALDAAVKTLQDRDADLVLWGGSDRSMDVSSYIQFSKIGALSPDGSRPFDAGANGFVMGEGCAMFLLKRLADAERDGDTIVAVVRGIGASSDGKGKGITAPNPAGQVKAVLRAYEDAAVEPASLGLLEAHGTSTPVGDPVELTSVQEAFATISKTPLRPGAIAVGSVKGNIGHLKAAAGAAGVLKAALALQQGILPPSINVQTLNPRIEWATSPFKVNTAATPWPRPEGTPRRAAVSSFGFGGTNFHIVLEEHIPGRLKARTAQSGKSSVQSVESAPMLDTAAFQAHMSRAAALEAEPLVLDAATAPQVAAKLMVSSAPFAATGQGARLRDLLAPPTQAGVAGSARVGITVASLDEIGKKLEQAQKAATNPAAARLSFNQGVFINKGAPQGKVAFLFPGQGTQYVNMLRDLAQKYEVVRNTFEEADQALISELGGVKLTDILWPTPDTPEAQAASDKKLQLTEYTQPAVLAADVALLRLLRQWGIEPHIVAGHSLGEYGALVAAGVLTFSDALHAVAARGREMAHVEVPDLGKMASVSADWHAVESALQGMTEYVIPANKNCPSQTVIAGSSKGVDEAVKLLTAKGLQAQYLPVSAAFHSAIVAPASKPLRRVLGRLDVKAPKVRVLSNVGTEPYQDDPDWIRDNLATQVASPVEWIGIIERMYAEGVRTFVEVGPKLALTNFVRDILKEKPDAVAIGSNHPKKGGVTHANELFAFLGAWGFKPTLPDLADPGVYTASFRNPAAAFQRQPSAVATQAASDVGDLARQVAELRRAVDEIRGGRTTTAQPLMTQSSQTVSAPSAKSATPSGDVDAEVKRRLAAFGFSLDDIGISGISVGLPGRGHPLFDEGNWDRIIRGENLIDVLPEDERAKLADKNIVRLVKGIDGSAQFQAIQDVAQVIQLAGQRGGFDVESYGVGKELAESLDRTFQYAIAAGLEALRDAGIPLQRTYLATSQGGWLPKEWKLPESLRDETGIIFASAFPGYDNLLRDVSRYLADKYSGRTRSELNGLYNELLGAVTDAASRERLQSLFDREFQGSGTTIAESSAARYEFNRKFLFNVLSMGHSQLAQFIGARGPNTQVNAACASTTQAIAIAEDWIRTGRARRVLVVGADDVTSDAMFEWIGSGFLASGAATTKADVKEAALPFDKRRHGMIVGMGAVGLVLEATPECAKRGMRPIARLLATRVSNSAFHGSRLDVEHIAGEMTALLASAAARYGIAPATIAAQTVFMSHETYTPARGGSASAEIAALRAAFGAQANQVVVANTKGFTGHPQGAGIEDAIVLKCLQRGLLPPIANFRDPDPELGDLNLSKGGSYSNLRFALRLAAGFGSQVAMSLTELVAKESERIADAGRNTVWLGEVSGLPGAKTEVVNRTLRIVDQGAPVRKAKAAEPIAAPTPKPQMTQTPQTVSAPSAKSAAPSSGGATVAQVLEKLIAVVAEKTGYPKDLLDPNLDMEADLGIDTVKQAEIFGLLREHYGIAADQSVQIKDYNTLAKVAAYMQARTAGGSTPTLTQPQMPQNPQTPVSAPSVKSATPAAPVAASGDVLDKLIQVVAEKTGYPKDLLDPNLDMEADLGIDTVKQAEIFGLLREHYGIAADQSVQIKDYPTLAKVAGYMQSRIGGVAPTPPAPALSQIPQIAQSPAVHKQSESVKSATPSGGGRDEAAVLRKVIDLVAAKTGYPAEMLEPDLDMEADLGIDTVKQAELFGEVRTAYNIPLAEGLQIKDYPTLRKVAGFVLQNSAPVAAPAQPPIAPISQMPTSLPSAKSVDSSGVILRRIPQVRPQDLPSEPNTLRPGPVLLLGDPDNHIADALTAAGFNPLHQLASGQVPVGLVAVASRNGLTALERCGPLFDAAKLHRASLTEGTFVLVVTRQDGSHGLHHVRDAGMAALAGLGKAIKKELPQAVVKVVDIHPEAGDASKKLLAELTRGGKRTEVAYGRDGARFIVEVAPQELPAAELDVERKSLVVSGGAQGITVELLAALAAQNPNLLLLGRTELTSDAAALAALDAAGWKALETTLVADLKTRGEKVTPVTIQKALAPKQKAAEVHRNLERLQALGATVIYAPVDVADAKAVAEAVTFARAQFGRIDGVIHAAGLEISKDLASKERAQFDSVFNVKAKGWDALMAATRDDKLSFLVAFGSVAGRFGNIGQTDYSAANEYLAKAVKQEAARRKCLVGTTIAWGPWGEVGMATKGSILQIMHASGVTPIPTAEGVRHFLAELAQPGIRESVVAGTLGAIDADGQVVEKGFDLAVEVANQVLTEKGERFRLLSSIDSIVPDKSLTATVIVDQARDSGLADHKVDGVPYLPGVFGLEAFAEAALLLAPADHRVVAAENVRFALPLKQLKATPQRGILTATRLEGKEVKVACRLTSQFHGPDGKPVGEPKLHFEATLTLAVPATAPRAAVPLCDRRLKRGGIYPPFFHGPSFQVLEFAGPLDGEAVAQFRNPTEPHFGAGPATFAAEPMLVEALFQTCGLRTLAAEHRMSLPAGIARVAWHSAILPPDVRLRAKPTGRDPAGNRTFDAEAVASDGTVLVRLTGFSMVETGPASAPVATGSASAPGAAANGGAAHAPNALRIHVADVPLPHLERAHIVAVRVESKACEPANFSLEESRIHGAFPVAKRADEWRAGRLAAKQVAVDTHPGTSLRDFEVRGDDKGKPRLFLEGSDTGLQLSITHRDGLALAALSDAPIGIDLETVEERPQAFLEEAFSVNELRHLLSAADAKAEVACMWAAKEAALKRAGVGLKADLRAHQVIPDGSGGATVEGPTGRVGVRFFMLDGKVLAVSAAELDRKAMVAG
ncbi:MAG: SDR family NAD(P)-dependent oxidoreductase [Candidatus Thermoplasmatota archaeon]